jgi:hypothetical protein
MRIYAHGVPVFLTAASLSSMVFAGSRQPLGNQAPQHQQPNDQTKATSHTPQSRKIPCKIPENASSCYWTHGRLAIANGNPSFRIWKIGTHRLYNGPSHFPPRGIADDESPEFPVSLDHAYEAYNRRMKRETGSIGAIPPPTYADFEVCPLEPEKPEEMQAVCIESAKQIVIPKDY